MPSAPPTTERNQTGQTMGAKGRNTRLRLMQAASTLLGAGPLSGLRVAEIAAAAGTSTAAFYRYFAGTADIALAIAEGCTQSTEPLLQMAGADWPEHQADQRAETFVETYFRTWESNAAILRMRNLAAEEGDRRFYAAREKAVRPLQDALANRLQRAQRKGQVPDYLVPQAAAGALIALLERMAAIARQPHEPPSITYDTLVQATAYILTKTLPPAA
jgi:AcrR family transcriptional regulator